YAGARVAFACRRQLAGSLTTGGMFGSHDTFVTGIRIGPRLRRLVLLPSATTPAPSRSTRLAPSHRGPCGPSPRILGRNSDSGLPFAAGGRLASHALQEFVSLSSSSA